MCACVCVRLSPPLHVIVLNYMRRFVRRHFHCCYRIGQARGARREVNGPSPSARHRITQSPDETALPSRNSRHRRRATRSAGCGRCPSRGGKAPAVRATTI